MGVPFPFPPPPPSFWLVPFLPPSLLFSSCACVLTFAVSSSAGSMPVHFLQCDPAASAESVPARKRQHLDCGVPVTVEATTASTRLASHPVTAIESGPSLLLRPLAPSNAAALGDDASVAQSCPPSGHVSPPSCSVFGVHSDLAATSVPLEELGLKHSLARLEAESHAVRLRQSRAVQNDSQTGPSYARHLTHYRLWWESDQARRHAAEPEYTIIPPFPVTAAKVAMFLEYETTREKVGPPLRGTSCALDVLAAHMCHFL